MRVPHPSLPLKSVACLVQKAEKRLKKDGREGRASGLETESETETHVFG